MALVKWQFVDPVTTAVHVFEVNPSPSSTAQPEYNKNLSFEVTADADGQTIVYEGRREVQRLEWEGVTFEQAEHEMFVDWWDKGYQIDVTDDRGRTLRVYLTNYKPKRVAALQHPDKRSYSMVATVIGT